LFDLLKPPEEAIKAIAEVEMPPELLRAIADLDDARAERLALIRGAQGDDKESTGRKLRAALDKIEERIKTLRARRAELLVPHNAKVFEAVAPLVSAAATKLRASAIAMREAITKLSDLALMVPPRVPGLPNGLEPVGLIDLKSTLDTEHLANVLLQSNPETIAK
jgi:hypothetical protein